MQERRKVNETEFIKLVVQRGAGAVLHYCYWLAMAGVYDADCQRAIKHKSSYSGGL